MAGPSPPPSGASPSFSVNGSNAAKNATATLTAAGNYAFSVTITDPGGMAGRPVAWP